MREMSEDTGTKESGPSAFLPDSPGAWMTLAGFLLFAFGLVAAVSVFSEMNDSLFGEGSYDTVDRWIGVLAAVTVSGLGLAVAGIGMILGHLEDRSGR